MKMIAEIKLGLLTLEYLVSKLDDGVRETFEKELHLLRKDIEYLEDEISDLKENIGRI